MARREGRAPLIAEERAVSGPTTSAVPEPADPPRTPPTGESRAAVVEPGPAAARPPGQGRRLAGSVVLGLLTVVYGLLVMSMRPAAIATVALFAGFALLAGGIVQLALAGGVDRPWRWLAYAAGLVSVVAGIAAFAWPGLTLLVLAVLVAWSLVINGVVRIVASVTGRHRDLWWLGLIAGVVELLLGLWAIGAPGREVLLLVNLLGIYLVIAGVDAVVTAIADRSPQPEPR
jgi:uncharacterized membrane protein HdeD (DUF308 family)